jgi:hypothetical protein
MVSWLRDSLPSAGGKMVEFVKISKKGFLKKIKEVPDKYRDQPYRWDEDE